MGIKDDYYIQEIDYSVAMQLVKKNHYLHRACPCSYAFGLFRKNDIRIYGCVTYGCPPSRALQKGICGVEEADNVLELNRLWISDIVGANAESFLVGNTLKMLEKEIIVSYADTSQNHVGYIYQATNFIYTGLSAKRTEWKIEGFNGHARSISRGETVDEIKEKYGDKFSYIDRPQKHRYIFFNANKKRKKELMAKLKYPVMPYPKATTKRENIIGIDIMPDVQMTLLDMDEIKNR